MLRAVLSRDDCRHLVSPNSATYLGTQFPVIASESGERRDFAVLSFDDSEADAEWQSGFYRFDADLMEVNAVLLRLAR
jgi:hypothetical protein